MNNGILVLPRILPKTGTPTENIEEEVVNNEEIVNNEGETHLNESFGQVIHTENEDVETVNSLPQPTEEDIDS
ncbi:MAG: hypothetical protein H6546_06960 [Chitinophagales bacterium]|nr:hypothetical protein [Chitinophagales bacterium]